MRLLANLIVGITLVVTVPATAWAQQQPKLEDEQELAKRVTSFRKQFTRLDKKALLRRNLELKEIANTHGLTDPQRKKLMRAAEEKYKSTSRKLVRRYRAPIDKLLINIVNDGLPKNERIEGGLGSGFYPKNRLNLDRHISKPEPAPPPRRRGPHPWPKPSTEHSGRLGDTDSQGGGRAMARMTKLARKYGFHVNVDGDTMEITALNHTVNRHASEGGKPGSRKHRRNIAAGARNKERFLAVGIDKNRGFNATREQVSKQDHMKKAAPGIALGRKNSRKLFKKKNQPKLQVLAKSTHKMMANVPDEAIARFMRNNGLQGSPADFRAGVHALYRRNFHSSGVGKHNHAEWFRTVQDVQQDSVRRANKLAEAERKRRRADIARLNKEASDPKSSKEKRRRARDTARSMKRRLIDSEVRLKESIAANDEYHGRKPADTRHTKPAPRPSPLKARRPRFSENVNQPVDDGPGFLKETKKRTADVARRTTDLGKQTGSLLGKGVLKGVGAFGTYQTLKELRDAIASGDLRKVRELALDEAKDKLLERVIPVWGQLKTAYDLGSLAGQLGANIPIGPNGETLGQLVEQRAGKVYDAYSGNKRLVVQRQRERSEQDMVRQEFAGRTLPPNLTRTMVMEQARRKAALGFSFDYAVWQILDDAENRYAALLKRRNDHSGGDNDRDRKGNWVWRSHYCGGIANGFVSFRYPIINGVDRRDLKETKNNCQRVRNQLRRIARQQHRRPVERRRPARYRPYHRRTRPAGGYTRPRTNTGYRRPPRTRRPKPRTRYPRTKPRTRYPHTRRRPRRKPRQGKTTPWKMEECHLGGGRRVPYYRTRWLNGKFKKETFVKKCSTIDPRSDDYKKKRRKR